MKPVGLRELKSRLSYYIRRVRTGKHILISDRGEVVAELAPPGETFDSRGLPAALLALARKNEVRLASSTSTSYPALPPALRRRTSAELLDEERGPA
jgi:antitoxin (DNA-binding transcriptional repressor) of toxin-antitoxin stability system